MRLLRRARLQERLPRFKAARSDCVFIAPKYKVSTPYSVAWSEPDRFGIGSHAVVYITIWYSRTPHWQCTSSARVKRKRTMLKIVKDCLVKFYSIASCLMFLSLNFTINREQLSKEVYLLGQGTTMLV